MTHIIIKKGYKGTIFNTVKIGDKCDKLFKVKGVEEWEVIEGFLSFISDLLLKIGERYEALLKKKGSD